MLSSFCFLHYCILTNYIQINKYVWTYKEEHLTAPEASKLASKPAEAKIATIEVEPHRINACSSHCQSKIYCYSYSSAYWRYYYPLAWYKTCLKATRSGTRFVPVDPKNVSMFGGCVFGKSFLLSVDVACCRWERLFGKILLHLLMKPQNILTFSLRSCFFQSPSHPVYLGEASPCPDPYIVPDP